MIPLYLKFYNADTPKLPSITLEVLYLPQINSEINPGESCPAVACHRPSARKDKPCPKRPASSRPYIYISEQASDNCARIYGKSPHLLLLGYKSRRRTWRHSGSRPSRRRRSRRRTKRSSWNSRCTRTERSSRSKGSSGAEGLSLIIKQKHSSHSHISL